MIDLKGSQEAMLPLYCPAVSRKLAEGAQNDWTLAARNIAVPMILDDWKRMLTVVNTIGADGHGNYHTHYENINTNNTTAMPFILTL